MGLCHSTGIINGIHHGCIILIPGMALLRAPGRGCVPRHDPSVPKDAAVPGLDGFRVVRFLAQKAGHAAERLGFDLHYHGKWWFNGGLMMFNGGFMVV